MNAKRLMWETKKLQLKKTYKKKEQNIKNSFWHKAVFRLTQKQHKILWARATHAVHVKIWLTHPRYPRHLRFLVDF